MDRPISAFTDEPDESWDLTATHVLSVNDRDELVIDCRNTEFIGIITNVNPGSVDTENLDPEITEQYLDMRQAWSECQSFIELREEIFGHEYGREMVPIDAEMFHDGDVVGVRFSTTVDGQLYGFETVIARGRDDTDDVLVDMQIQRQMRQLREQLWDDFVASKAE